MKHNGRGLRINPGKKAGPSQRKVLKAMLGSSRSNQTSIAETKRASRLLQDHRPVFTFGAQSEFIRKKKFLGLPQLYGNFKVPLCLRLSLAAFFRSHQTLFP